MFQDIGSILQLLRFMRKIKISRRGDIFGANKGSALCVGAHGAGNNSQCDCVLELYEK